MKIKNWQDCYSINYNGNNRIKLLSIEDSSFVKYYFITDNNDSHGFIRSGIDYLDIKNTYPMSHKVSIDKITYAENLVLPEGVSINLSSSNQSAKYVVCGSNMRSDDLSDYLIGTVGGSAGGTLTRSVATSSGIPTLTKNGQGDLVFNQGVTTGKYAFYPIGMFYVAENSSVGLSAKIYNTGNTNGQSFYPFMAIVNCKTGKLVDRYAGNSKTATADGVAISYARQVQKNHVVLCYFSVSSAVSGSETTFKDYTVYRNNVLAPAVVNEPYTAKRLTGDGTLTSLSGVNNIMCSDLTFNVSLQADYVNNPIIPFA